MQGISCCFTHDGAIKKEESSDTIRKLYKARRNRGKQSGGSRRSSATSNLELFLTLFVEDLNPSPHGLDLPLPTQHICYSGRVELRIHSVFATIFLFTYRGSFALALAFHMDESCIEPKQQILGKYSARKFNGTVIGDGWWQKNKCEEITRSRWICHAFCTH